MDKEQDQVEINNANYEYHVALAPCHAIILQKKTNISSLHY